jgi:hypothetical protein
MDHFSRAIDQPVADIEIDPEQWILHHISSLVVGIDDLHNPIHFTIGPNPVRDAMRIYFSTAQQEARLSITDLSGKQVVNQMVSGSISEMDVSGLNAGLYIVRVTDGEREMVKKMVKSR